MECLGACLARRQELEDLLVVEPDNVELKVVLKELVALIGSLERTVSEQRPLVVGDMCRSHEERIGVIEGLEGTSLSVRWIADQVSSEVEMTSIRPFKGSCMDSLEIGKTVQAVWTADGYLYEAELINKLTDEGEVVVNFTEYMERATISISLVLAGESEQAEEGQETAKVDKIIDAVEEKGQPESTNGMDAGVTVKGVHKNKILRIGEHEFNDDGQRYKTVAGFSVPMCLRVFPSDTSVIKQAKQDLARKLKKGQRKRNIEKMDRNRAAAWRKHSKL